MIPSILRSNTQRLLASRTLNSSRQIPRRFASAVAPNEVKIVEVGPRDGLQNEKGIIPVDVKVELINRLGKAGLKCIEAGSFVSPKWVPQMAGTDEIITKMHRLSGVHYPVLVPNLKGLENLLSLLSSHNSPSSSTPPPTDEISIFTSATDAFAQANINTTVQGSLERLAPVTRAALDRGLRVRGYVSVAIYCPYSGKVDYKKARDVAKALIEMGCYEVSVADTVGMARPHEVGEMLEEVKKGVPVEKLAGHYHDTYGQAIANVLTSLQHGIRTIDSSVAGLGGCPYSPGATGNVATEDVLYALLQSEYTVAGNVDLNQVAETGWWISERLGRETTSRVGKAMRAKNPREKELAKEHKARL